MGVTALGAETGQDVCSRESGEGPQGDQPEADQHVGQPGPAQHRNRKRGQEGRASRGGDHQRPPGR